MLRCAPLVGVPPNPRHTRFAPANPVCPSIRQTTTFGSPPDVARRSRDARTNTTYEGGNQCKNINMREENHNHHQGEQNKKDHRPRHQPRADDDPDERGSSGSDPQPVCAPTDAAPAGSPDHTCGDPATEGGRVRPVQQRQPDRPRRERDGEGADQGRRGSGAAFAPRLSIRRVYPGDDGPWRLTA